VKTRRAARKPVREAFSFTSAQRNHRKEINESPVGIAEDLPSSLRKRNFRAISAGDRPV